MKRRELIATAAAGALAAGPACAQRLARPVRLGYLAGGFSTETNLSSVRLGLTRIGWAEGRDFTIAARYAEFDYSRFPALTADLLREKIDILITAGPAARVAPLAQHVVPVVFAFSGDPVAAGFAAGFARPGGNATGISFLALELAGKRLDILREAAPSVRRVAVIHNPDHPGVEDELRVSRESGDRLGLETVFFAMRDRSEVAAALARTGAAGCDSLTCFPDAFTLSITGPLTQHARAGRMPSIFGWKSYCEAGGLLSYGPSIVAGYVRLAFFIERIAGGTRAGDLPIELPTVIETVVNQKTAQAIGLVLPPILLARADVVIE